MRVERLTEAHELSGFASGVKPLDDWLRLYALDNQQRDLSRTFVPVEDGEVDINDRSTTAGSCNYGCKSPWGSRTRPPELSGSAASEQQEPAVTSSLFSASEASEAGAPAEAAEDTGVSRIAHEDSDPKKRGA